MSRRRRRVEKAEENSSSDLEDCEQHSDEEGGDYVVKVTGERQNNDKTTGKLVYSTNMETQNESGDLEGATKELAKERRKEKDPSVVPKTGKFFLHDDRGEGRNSRGTSFQKSFGKTSRRRSDVEENTWKHDKFEELIAKERKNPGDSKKPLNQKEKHLHKQDQTTRKLHKQEPTAHKLPKQDQTTQKVNKMENVSPAQVENAPPPAREKEREHSVETSIVSENGSIEAQQNKAVALNPSAQEFKPSVFTAPISDYAKKPSKHKGGKKWNRGPPPQSSPYVDAYYSEYQSEIVSTPEYHPEGYIPQPILYPNSAYYNPNVIYISDVPPPIWYPPAPSGEIPPEAVYFPPEVYEVNPIVEDTPHVSTPS